MLALLIGIALVVVAISVKFLRKTLGLLLIILGGLASATFVGLPIGIPMIVIGGIFLFI